MRRLHARAMPAGPQTAAWCPDHCLRATLRRDERRLTSMMNYCVAYSAADALRSRRQAALPWQLVLVPSLGNWMPSPLGITYSVDRAPARAYLPEILATHHEAPPEPRPRGRFTCESGRKFVGEGSARWAREAGTHTGPGKAHLGDDRSSTCAPILIAILIDASPIGSISPACRRAQPFIG